MEKSKVEIVVTLGLEDVVAYLENLAEGLRSGKVLIEGGGRQALLTPAARMEMEIKARTKGEKQKLSLELSWRAEGEGLKVGPAPEGEAAEDDGEVGD